MIIKQREPIIIPDPWDDLKTKLCKARGISDIKEFISPTKKQVHSYKLLNNCELASQTIIDAMKRNKKICIHLDIDTDGVTSGVLMFKYLSNFTDNVFLIFHERQGGHGVKVEEVPNDCDLLIIVDSSTNSFKECEELSKITEIIILDHHPQEVGINNPYAKIVNPLLCDYPNKSLSGVGVVYKICECLDVLLDKKIASEYLDIVATGLIGDMMSMRSMENRYLVSRGLALMKSSSKGNKGIKCALKVLKKDKIDSSVVAFYLVPLLNSSIRLDNIASAIELLALDDEDECLETAILMKKRNDDRKTKQKEILEIITPLIDLDKKYIFLDSSRIGINPNLIGLIANDLSAKFKKPTFLVENKNNIFYGSARSGGIKYFKEKLLGLKVCDIPGGHSEAFGIRLKADKFDSFNNKLTQFLDTLPDKVVLYDIDVSLDEIDIELCKIIKQLNHITGQDFGEIVLRINDISFNEVNTMGSDNNHLKIKVGDIDIVKFFIDDELIKKLNSDKKMDILATLDINSWFNFKTKREIKNKQIRIIDIL